MLVIIPTYNRSLKLCRVLDFYASLSLQFKIVVLDGSNETNHQEFNAAAARRHASFVTRLACPEHEGLIPRVLSFLTQCNEEILALGNDEDAFLPEFLELAHEFLHKNPDYSAVVGRYVTFARPLLGLKRISFWTDSFAGLDIDADDPALRVINFQRLNSGGVSPLYWGIRRKASFIESMELGKRVKYGSGQELLDQIVVCAMGKVHLSDKPMLIRDESKLHYKPYNNRDTGTLYMAEEDMKVIREIATERWNGDVSMAVRAVTDWYKPHSNGESYCSRQVKRVYCRFNEAPEEGGSRALRSLRRAISWSCIAGNLTSQFLAYFYFRRLMSLNGKKAEFLKLSNAVPTHSQAQSRS